MKAKIDFRPAQVTDLPMLRAWIAQPHWQDWWGAPDLEMSYIDNMLAGRDTTEPYIAQMDGRDFGYIQCWFLHDHLVGDHLLEPWLSEAPWMVDLPHDAVGVDLAIGDEADLGQGFGTAILTAFVEKLHQKGHKTILIDPKIGNIRAVSAYKKAGFAAIPAFLGKTGDVFLMQYDETHPKAEAA